MRSFQELVTGRIAVDEFDPIAAIPREELAAIVSTAIQAPSAFNAQQWRFVAVTDMRLKVMLQDATIETNQQRLAEAAMIMMVLGDMKGHRKLRGILNDAAQAGLLRTDVAETWIATARSLYNSNPEAAKTDAIRSASLAAMLFMLAALERGYASCPIGFDQEKARKILQIDAQYELVMMIAVGRAKGIARPHRPRLQVHEVLGFDLLHAF